MSAAPVLSVQARHRLGDFTLDAAFESDAGLTALFGASGAGKTSLLRVIAGLVRPQQARIAIGESVLVDTGHGRFTPAHRRGVGYVFQEPRLLPHLSVRGNLHYGSRFSGVRQPAAGFDRLVQLLDIGALLERAPASLSGGEAQRVALGRALLSQPRLLLMDEPLAAVDEPRRSEILPIIERLRDELRIPIVYVSHALDEVVRLAGAIAVLDRGRVVACGATTELLGRLDLPILARRADAGVVLDAAVADHDDRWQLTTLQSRAGTLRVPRLQLSPGSAVRLWIRARDVSLATEAPAASSILNVLAARVVEVGTGSGATVDVRLDCGGAPLLARITRLSADRLALRPGLSIQALVKGVALEPGSPA